MELKHISKWVVISGALMIGTIKFLIRPYYHFEQPTTFLLGIAPNLLGSILLPFGAYWFFSGRQFLLARIFRIHSAGDLKTICLLSLVMLIINEYLQLIPFFGRTFDYFDIISSAVGLSISYIVFSKIFNRVIYRPSSN